MRTQVQNDASGVQSKLMDPEVLVDLFDLGATLPFEPRPRTDTTDILPAEAVARIALPLFKSD